MVVSGAECRLGGNKAIQSGLFGTVSDAEIGAEFAAIL